MHIKHITISNFRSFRQQGEIHEFSPNANALVGRNGSGKSNLFDAVQFCLLAPRFANLRQEERQALLHEGSGSAAVAAFVEIVFDNADQRLQLGETSDEVVLRRTIGLKKDEFFLQRKRAQKQEIMSLLEGAGFSKCNPYYIVQQGKVQSLCTMSDADRLRLLHEVAGTITYDEKKAESLAKMEENASSIEKMEQILQEIEDRLNELQEEKEELSAYQLLDRRRRAMEYTLFEKELVRARSNLDTLEKEREDHLQHVLSVLHDQAKQTHTSLQQVAAEYQRMQNTTYRRHRLELEALEQDKKDAVTVVTKLNLSCQELQDAITSGEETLAAEQAELKQLKRDIAKAQAELDQVDPQYQQASALLQQQRDDRDAQQRQLAALNEKEGRGRQFESVEARNAFLQETLQDLQTASAEKQSELHQRREAYSHLQKQTEKEKRDMERMKSQLAQQSANAEELSLAVDEKRKERLALLDQRKEVWSRAEQLEEQIRDTREQQQRAHHELRKSMARTTAQGIDALERQLVDREGLVRGQHYFGTVLDNVQLRDPKYRTAVEAAAQNALFHIIVDTDQTAARLMKRLEDGQLGRVTFLPLNQLRVDDRAMGQLPEHVSDDIRNLLHVCLQYDPAVARAMQHVFGRKLLARSLELAAEWSTKLQMDAITLDGDLCSRKGALSGGYIDSSRSRMKAHAQLVQARQALNEYQASLQQVQIKTQEADRALAQITQDMQRLDAKCTELNQAVTAKETTMARAQTRLDQQQKQADNLVNKAIPALEKDLSLIQADMERIRGEMASPMSDTLSHEERIQLDEIKQRAAGLQASIEEQSDVVAQLGLQRQQLQSLLQDNLMKRQEELEGGLTPSMDEDRDDRNAEDEDCVGGSSMELTASTRRRRRSSKRRITRAALLQQQREELEERQHELQAAIAIKEELESRLHEARDVKGKELRSAMIAMRDELERLKQEDRKNVQDLEAAQLKSETLMTKRAMAISKRETYIRKIQELGSLPPPAELAKFAAESITALGKAIDNVNRQLKKYAHINKKALDQYMNFSEQREALLKRKEELDLGAKKVEELIESLDQQKNEAINRTFRGVSKHFQDVFQELVPLGKGDLIMRVSHDEADDISDEDDVEATENEKDDEVTTGRFKKSNAARSQQDVDVSRYIGIGIKVRFSAVGENFIMSQLSGGQKALVALALIFSIQRCDPAPFYLFDELDQALDSTYRGAVAKVIQKQATSSDNPTQFIVSTFRPELVKVANKCYGISLQNKVSNLLHMNKKDALAFVANLRSEEEAVGEVSTLGASTRNASRGSNTHRHGDERSRNRQREAGRLEQDDGGNANEGDCHDGEDIATGEQAQFGDDDDSKVETPAVGKRKRNGSVGFERVLKDGGTLESS